MSKETDQSSLIKEINEIKKEVSDISYKVDLMLEILNNFTIMLAEENEDEESQEYNSEWMPEQEEDWDFYEDDLDG